MPRSSVLLAGACLLVSCQLVGGFETFDDVAPATPKTACASLPDRKEDARGQAVMARVDVPGGSCFWIDTTETTVQQYQAFLDAAVTRAPAFEPTWCQWKEQLSDPAGTPRDACVGELARNDVQPFGPTKPIRCVDFCDAQAYCAWSGKHLCYDRSQLGNQGPVGMAQEWLLACTNSRTTVYPWGDEATAGDCNFGQTADHCVAVDYVCGPRSEGANTNCKSARGVVHLLGNVSEWTYLCGFINPEQPLEPTGCVTRGGAYDDAPQACSAQRTVPADARAPSLGFRCCADLTAAEQLRVEGP
jgi:formylglycine-generating enzyme required for sulfatase activity